MMRRPAAVAVAFALCAIALSWPVADLGVWGAFQNDEYSRIAFNLARHGVYQDESGVRPYMYREPGYPLFLAAVFASSPEFADVPSWECVEDPECAEATPVRERGWRLAFLLAAAATAIAFLLTFVLTRSWTVSVVIGGGWSVLLMPLAMAWDVPSTLAGLLLLVHAGLAAQMWRNPRIATGVLSGIALGLLVLNKAVFQYWLVGVALVLVTGLWRDPVRRRTLAPPCAALVLTALSLTLPWMARNYIAAGHFTMSGRAGVVLAVRAEYGRMTWSEVRGAFAYYLPRVYSWPPSDQIVPFHRLRAFAMRWLEPETFAYLRLDDRDPQGFYQSVRLGTGAVAERADLIDTRWRRCCGGEIGMTDVDVALKGPAVDLIREDWLTSILLL